MLYKNILEVIFIFILPVIFVYFKFEYRIKALATFCFLSLVFTWRDGYSLQQIGIRLDDVPIAIIPYAIFTLVAVIFIIAYSKRLKQPVVSGWYRNPALLLTFIPVSILQELMYRGYLMLKLREIFSSAVVIIIVNALLFAYIHIIFENKWRLVILTFLGGLGFATMYYYYPNMLLISASHAILNLCAAVYSYFPIGLKEPTKNPFQTGKDFAVG